MTTQKRTRRRTTSDDDGSIWAGLAKLADAVGPHGVPFTAVFMSNVVVLFVILFLNDQFEYMWAVGIGFAAVELSLGTLMYVKKRPVLSEADIAQEEQLAA